MERVKGIEPSSLGWKPRIISHYTTPAFGEEEEIRTLCVSYVRDLQSRVTPPSSPLPHDFGACYKTFTHISSANGGVLRLRHEKLVVSCDLSLC